MRKSSTTAALALALPAVMLSGCYYISVDQELLARIGVLADAQKDPKQATPPAPKQLPVNERPAAGKPVSIPLAALPARLYPVNEIATGNGMVSGTVTSLADGKARFQLNYRGELLLGEATRVSGDDRKGVATAWGPNGSFMSCEYQMSTPARGAGTCSFSDGARYQVHVGN